MHCRGYYFIDPLGDERCSDPCNRQTLALLGFKPQTLRCQQFTKYTFSCFFVFFSELVQPFWLWAGVFALKLAGCGVLPWPNPSSNLPGRTEMPHFRIIWQGHPDITNKLEKDVESNQTKHILENSFSIFKYISGGLYISRW